MTKMVIDSAVVREAVRASEDAEHTPLGKLSWEFGLMWDCPHFWRDLEPLMAGSQSGPAVRALLTYVYHAVYVSRQMQYPSIRSGHWRSVIDSYAEQGGIVAARDRALELMASVSAEWSVRFQEQIPRDAARMDPSLIGMVWCAVILLLARSLGESFRRPSAEPLSAPESPAKTTEKPDPATAKTIQPVTSTISFDDIGGLHDAKARLIRLAARINQPSVGRRWGVRPIRAVLLKGPQGTGKTTLAHALANAVNLPFFPLKTSDVLSVWVNQSAMQLTAIFDGLRSGGGGLLLLDEADSILAKRGGVSSHHEDDKIVNQWNQCIDSLTDTDRIVVVLATNFSGRLDDAAIRDGRVDVVIDVPAPASDRERGEILGACMARIERRAEQPIFKGNINYALLANQMAGMTGAGIENVINRALCMKEDEELAGRWPGLVSTEDLLRAFEQRLRERPFTKKHPIGYVAEQPSVVARPLKQHA